MREATAESVKRSGLPAGFKGALVTEVKKGSLADRAGLTRGAIVTKVDNTAVTSAATFEQGLQRASAEKGALLHVLRQNGDADFVVLRVK